nr:ras guanine nucleotide exchange factor k [Quercus suber]
MPPPSSPQMLPPPNASSLHAPPIRGPPTTSSFAGAKDLASLPTHRPVTGMSISSMLGGSDEHRVNSSPRSSAAAPCSASRPMQPPSPGRARSSSMREGRRELSPHRSGLLTEPRAATAYYDRGVSEPRKDGAFESSQLQRESVHSFRNFQPHQPERRAIPNGVSVLGRPSSQPLDLAGSRGIEDMIRHEPQGNARFGPFRQFGEPLGQPQGYAPRVEAPPRPEVVPAGATSQPRENPIFGNQHTERDVRNGPFRFQSGPLGTPMREDQAGLFRPSFQHAPDVARESIESRMQMESRREPPHTSPPMSDMHALERSRIGFADRPMTFEEHQRMEASQREQLANRKESDGSVHRAVLNLSPELGRKGRNTPQPQAIQGAQPRQSGPTKDNPRLNAFGRMFSGLGSGAGSATPTPGQDVNGTTSPSRGSPLGHMDDIDAPRHANAGAEQDRIATKANTRGGKKGGRRTRDDAFKTEQDGSKITINSESRPLPRLEDKENCTFTVRVPRWYVAPRDEAGLGDSPTPLEVVCKTRQIWGTDVYTDDSDVLAAAVHSGWIRGDFGELHQDLQDLFPTSEIAASSDAPDSLTQLLQRPDVPREIPKDHDVHVTLLILPPLQNYASTIRHHVRSREWGKQDQGHDGMSYMIHKIEFVNESRDNRFVERGVIGRKQRSAMEEVKRREAAAGLVAMFASVSAKGDVEKSVNGSMADIMSWPNPFRRRTENTRTCWGYTFEHTPLHLTPDETQPLKQSYDVLGEQVLARLNELAPPSRGKELPRRRVGEHEDGEAKVWAEKGKGDVERMEGVRQGLKDEVKGEEEGKSEGEKKGKRDLYVVLEENYHTDEVLSRFWEDVNLVPDWVDWAQIERGQDVFYRYGGACLTGLAYQSLLGGMGAARVVETLARTGGFSTKVARGRLFETTQHILQCTRSLDSIKPGGEGWKSTIRVRLLHAAVRQRILDLAKSRPGYYDTEAWGIPINDLDSMATIATFSATLIWLSLPRQGIFLRQQEIKDYLALWRYIAHVIGCPTDEFATPAQAKRLMDVLLYDEISPTPTSQILANNIIRSLESQPPGYASADFLIASARWMNGNDLADALGLARPSLYYWALMAGQCIFFCVFCYTYRAVPSWDRQKISMLKRVFWQIVVESKYGLKGEETGFELKYVPEYSTITEMGDRWDAQRPTSAVEGRNLKTFLVAVGALTVVGWVGVKAAVGVVRYLVFNLSSPAFLADHIQYVMIETVDHSVLLQESRLLTGRHRNLRVSMYIFRWPERRSIFACEHHSLHRSKALLGGTLLTPTQILSLANACSRGWRVAATSVLPFSPPPYRRRRRQVATESVTPPARAAPRSRRTSKATDLQRPYPPTAQYPPAIAVSGASRPRHEQHNSGLSYANTAASSTTHLTEVSNGGVRRGSVQPRGSLLERPQLQVRTYSAPSVNARFQPRTRATDGRLASREVEDYGDSSDSSSSSSSEEGLTEEEARDFAQAGVGALDLGQDDFENNGVVGVVRDFPSFVNLDLSVSEAIAQTINIAVVGAQGVGKSTFVQRALTLPSLPHSLTAEGKVPVEGSTYLVRLLELPIEDVDIDDEDDTVSWPDTIESKVMPEIDGALFLYDVGDQDSLKHIPDMLKATNKAALPSLLVSCKCDKSDEEREVDPTNIEQMARRSISGLNTSQTSENHTESHRRAVLMILKSVIFGSADYEARYTSSPHRRAQSSTVRAMSPRSWNLRNHSRASSEHTGILNIDKRHGRHDSSMARYGSSDRLKVPQYESQEGMSGSFLLEESASDASQGGSPRSSMSAGPGAQSASVVADTGVTFEELVDRLLAQPMSKSDSKFAAIFLALYRNFAAPGKLLEAIAERFDLLDRAVGAQMIKTVSQLRYLSILEQWLGTYPGDFAFPRTKRRMRTFTAKISKSRIFNVAAKEMSAHLDRVYEDDDTNWCYTDQGRERAQDDSLSGPTKVNLLIDDPSYNPVEDVNGKLLRRDVSGSTGSLGDTLRSALASSTSSQLLYSTEAAQKQAALLEAIPRQPLTKAHWRTLIEKSDDLVARELTRMDWVMFSSIRPRDLVRQVCLSPQERAKCKSTIHVDRMVEHFNQLACWASNFILLRDKPKHRALMLEKIMRIARKLRDLNNYNALGAIIAGVKSSAVHRLAATRNLIPEEVGRDWLKLEILMAPSRSHAAYRLAWENSTQERIPYFPLVRRDLVHAAEANKTLVDEVTTGESKYSTSRRINWKKFEITGEVIVGLQRAQGMPYREILNTRADPDIKELVLEVRLESDEEELYNRSTQCEPAATPSTVANAGAKLMDFFKRQTSGLDGSPAT